MAMAAMARPSITAWGSPSRIDRSHECARVSLVAVAGHILGEVIIGSRCAPLPSGRESGAAPSPEPGLFYFRDHFVRRHLQGFSQGLITAQFQVILNILRIDLSDMAESQFLLMCVEGIFLLGADPGFPHYLYT